MPSLQSKLRALRPPLCEPGLKWIGRKGIQRAWETCERADWMMLLAIRLGEFHRDIVWTACACARQALAYSAFSAITSSKKAIKAAEAWARGDSISVEEVCFEAHQCLINSDPRLEHVYRSAASAAFSVFFPHAAVETMVQARAAAAADGILNPRGEVKRIDAICCRIIRSNHPWFHIQGGLERKMRELAAEKRRRAARREAVPCRF